MLSDLRFVIGGALATALLCVTALGLITSAQITHQTRLTPLEAARRTVMLAEQLEFQNTETDDTRRADQAPLDVPTEPQIASPTESASARVAAKPDLPDVTTTASIPDALSPTSEPLSAPRAAAPQLPEPPPIVASTPAPSDIAPPQTPIEASNPPSQTATIATEEPTSAVPFVIAPATAAIASPTPQEPSPQTATVTPEPPAPAPGITASVMIEPATEAPASPLAAPDQPDAAIPTAPVGIKKTEAPVKKLAAKPRAAKEKAKPKKAKLARKPAKAKKPVRQVRRIARPGRKIIGWRIVQPASRSTPAAQQQAMRPPPQRFRGPLEELFGR